MFSKAWLIREWKDGQNQNVAHRSIRSLGIPAAQRPGYPVQLLVSPLKLRSNMFNCHIPKIFGVASIEMRRGVEKRLGWRWLRGVLRISKKLEARS